MKLPGPDHPITITRNGKRVRVTFAGRTIADTEAALTLKEASYKPALYVPRADTDMSLLASTDHHTHCPYKGDAELFHGHGRRPQRRKCRVVLRSSLTPQCQRSRNISRSIWILRGQSRGI